MLDLHEERITSVIWATGYRRGYSWLRVPVLDRRGDIAHRAGVTASPGLYVLGMQFQRRRNSNFIDGVGKDARYLAAEVGAHLGHAQLAIA
jgi:putative flavoprotein involved in K+ transport